MATTKSLGKKHSLDKFYTKPEVAKMCIDAVPRSYDLAIEPSAGSGAFSSQIPNCLAFDLAPEGDGILQQDWFEYHQERDPSKTVLVIGNPPFGQQNSLAIRFINHAAEFANMVAFILPASFRKDSVQNALSRHLHLVYEMALPKNSFTLDGEDYHVPSVFQVWEWRETLRPKTSRLHTTVNPLFDYVKHDANPDARVQRVGGNAGRADTNLTVSPASNYFIKIKPGQSLSDVLTTINSLVIPARDYSVGPRSISKPELNHAIIQALADSTTS